MPGVGAVTVAVAISVCLLLVMRVGVRRPDVVIVMNPVYEREIRADLSQRGLEPEVLTT